MVDFQLDRAVLAALETSDDVQDAMVAIARDGAVYAASISPVESGHFRDSFEVQRMVTSAGAILVNTDKAAVSIEFGTEDTPAAAVLSRTADWIENRE